MLTFPSLSLKFRKTGFPRYGFKAGRRVARVGGRGTRWQADRTGSRDRSHQSNGDACDEWAEDDPTYAACADGWPRILSRLKTLLETGKTCKPH